MLTFLFAIPLFQWVSLALSVPLHSHVILIPFISGYLIWLRRRAIPQPGNGDWPMTVLFGLGGVGLLLGAWWWGASLEARDVIALMIGAYLAGVVALGSACLGTNVLRSVTFPVCLLVFMVPMPSGLETLVEQCLQRLSAEAAHVLFWMFGETFLREGQVFVLPGLTIQVAQECSGIRSSVVLLILALLVANSWLRSSWRQILLVVAVIPLGILRNAVRIYVIAALTVHVDSGIIDSALHRHGGPIFFIGSLLPFTALVALLWKTEQLAGRRKTITSCS